MTRELRATYDDSYVRGDKDYGGENKESRIKSRFMSTRAQISLGPLLDLLKDLVDVCAVRYEDAPSGEEQKRMIFFCSTFLEIHPGCISWILSLGILSSLSTIARRNLQLQRRDVLGLSIVSVTSCGIRLLPSLRLFDSRAEEISGAAAVINTDNKSIS